MSIELTEQQTAEEEADRSKLYDYIPADATLRTHLYDKRTTEAKKNFMETAPHLFRMIAQNYHDEAELGRIAKSLFSSALENVMP